MAIRTQNTPDQIDVKIEEGGEEIRTGLRDLINWGSRTLGNTLSAGVHVIGAGISKLQENLGDDTDQTLIVSRKNITNAHMKKAKKRGGKALKFAGKTIGGGRKTVRGTGKVAIHSVRKTVKNIKNNSSEK